MIPDIPQIKISGALRRIGKLRQRSREEWQEHRAMADARYAAESAHMTAGPRLRKPDSREWREHRLTDFLAASLAPEYDPHTSVLVRRVVVRPR